jgi:HSP20 family protein
VSISHDLLRRALDVERHVENAFAEVIDTPWRRGEHILWHPAVDIYETSDAYIIVADLPGVEPSHIDLQVKHGAVVLCGRRVSLHIGRSCRHRIVERAVGRFCRTLRLEHEIDLPGKQESYHNGIYRAVLPKRKDTESER